MESEAKCAAHYKQNFGDAQAMTNLVRINSRREFLMSSAQAIAATVAGSTLVQAQRKLDWRTLRNQSEWQKARRQVLEGMQAVMGNLPEIKKGKVEIVEIEKEELQAFTRTKIKYRSPDGDWIPAYLLTPKNLKRIAPAMVCLHQTTKIGKEEPAGIGGSANLQYAKELAERGYVCLAPDYPYLGENDFDPYQKGYVSCTMKGIVNHIRAVDVLQSLPQVAKGRIGAVGHSLGGHNTLFVAAFDNRIRAMVTSCGFTSFGRYYNGDLTGWAGKRYMPLIAEKYGKDPAQMPFDFPDLLSSLAPRPLFINAPLRDSNFEVTGVKDCVKIAESVYSRVFKAKNSLMAVYPDAGHEFPSEIRKQAWSFLDQWLNRV